MPACLGQPHVTLLPAPCHIHLQHPQQESVGGSVESGLLYVPPHSTARALRCNAAGRRPCPDQAWLHYSSEISRHRTRVRFAHASGSLAKVGACLSCLPELPLRITSLPHGRMSRFISHAIQQCVGRVRAPSPVKHTVQSRHPHDVPSLFLQHGREGKEAHHPRNSPQGSLATLFTES